MLSPMAGVLKLGLTSEAPSGFGEIQSAGPMLPSGF